MGGSDFVARALLWYSEHLPWHRGKGAAVRAIKNTLHLHKDGDQEVTRLGLRWVLNPNDYGEGNLFWEGASDIWERYHIARFLTGDSVMFDVGANFGLYSLTLAHQLGPTVTIHCFEPNPVTYARLTRNISLNGTCNIHPHQLGLGDWEGTARVVASNDKNSGASCLTEGEGTRITTLDRFCEQHGGQRLDFMKLDIEGFEPRLLRGGLKALKLFKPTIQIELNPHVLLHAGSSTDEVLGPLQSL
jgi:FkbM family methyltransferase